MPDISQAMLPQYCVVWQKRDTKTHYGQVRLESPAEVRCRWNIGDYTSPTQDTTQEQYPRSISVGTEVLLGSYVWGPGQITDLPTEPKYLEVVGTEKIPDIKGRHPTYRITLQKASETLPGLAL